MLQFKDVAPPQLEELLALNESEVPHVSSLALPDFRRLSEISAYFRTAETEAGEIAGFLLAFDEKAPYSSPNFLWFKERYDSFVYVDRIIVSSQFRSQGIATALYGDIQQLYRGRKPAITCEVNLEPPNPISVEFHKKVGFSQVGTQATDHGKKTVSLLLKKL